MQLRCRAEAARCSPGRIPGHDSFADAARVLYDGRDGALRQMIAKIETAAGFHIVDASSTPLAPTGPAENSSAKRSRFSEPPKTFPGTGT